MNTLKDLAFSLRQGSNDASDVDLAKKTGLTRQSVSRAMSGAHNFNVNTLLAIAEANGQEVLLVSHDVARALARSGVALGKPVATMSDGIRDL